MCACDVTVVTCGDVDVTVVFFSRRVSSTEQHGRDRGRRDRSRDRHHHHLCGHVSDHQTTGAQTRLRGVRGFMTFIRLEMTGLTLTVVCLCVWHDD